MSKFRQKGKCCGVVESSPMAVTTPAEFSLQRKYLADRTNPVRWVWSHARRHWWIMTMMVIGAVGNAGLAAVVPVLTGDAFNAMLEPVPDTSVLIPLALIIGVSQIIRGALQLGRNFGAELLAQKLERSVRDELYLSLLGKSMTFHNLQPVGDTMARATNDVREINYMFSPGINLVVGSLVFPAGAYLCRRALPPGTDRYTGRFCPPVLCLSGAVPQDPGADHRRGPRHVWGDEYTPV